MVEQLVELKKELKKFIDSNQDASDYLSLLTSYEKARNRNVKVSDISAILEEVTKTKIPDEFD